MDSETFKLRIDALITSSGTSNMQSRLTAIRRDDPEFFQELFTKPQACPSLFFGSKSYAACAGELMRQSKDLYRSTKIEAQKIGLVAPEPVVERHPKMQFYVSK